VRTMGSDFKAGKNLLAMSSFGPWGDFLSLGHCLVKKDIE
jgi:hypothetical protein